MKKIYTIFIFALIALSSVSVFGQNFSIVGNGTTSSGTNNWNPYYNLYLGQRSQFFVTAAQLNAAGIPANSLISSLGFNIVQAGSGNSATLNGWTVTVRTTTATNPLTAAWLTSAPVTQSAPTNLSVTSTGWSQTSFPSFTWNGTDNLVIETCYNNSGWSSSYARVQVTTSGLGSATWSRWFRADNATVCSSTSVTSTSTNSRPNIRFGWEASSACSGTPNSGTASISSPSGCSGSAITLSSSGISSGTGISYQWQSASEASGPWTNIAGATTSTASLTPSATTFYRMVTTCSNSGATNTTNVVSYTITSCLNVPSAGSNTNPCGTNVSLFDSGGSGGNYVENSNGFTVLENAGSAIISLSGTSVGEACCDYVRIFRGVGTGGVVVGTYYMNSAIPTITSVAGEALTVQFFSDGSVVGAGFQINVAYSGSCVPTSPPPCASSPTAPTNATTGVSVGTTLSWPAVAGATGYDVYFGTSNPATTLVSSNQSGTTFNPGTLNALTTYHWRVIPKNSAGSATGCTTWSFTTGIPGCTGGTAYTIYTPTCSGTQEIYASCTYAGEYNTLTLTAGTPYTFGSSITSDYITVLTNTGTIITAGNQPLNFTPSASGNYRILVNTNSSCGTASSCRNPWVQCAPPPCTGTTVTLNMSDIWSDGWNGAQFRLQEADGTIYGPYTLASGGSGTQSICLPNGCYRVIT